MGILTRSMNLALKRHQEAVAGDDDDGLYLQLRNRRIKKLSSFVDANRNRNQKDVNEKNEKEVDGGVDGGAAGTGETIEQDASVERATRESTPDDVIIISSNMITPPPAPSSKRAISRQGNGRVLDEVIKTFVPDSEGLGYSLAHLEDECQKEFLNKYNFDPVNDKPMDGRYEWKKIEP